MYYCNSITDLKSIEKLSELNEIQHELNSLDDPCDPDQVSKLLEAKRNTLILQYECAIRYIYYMILA